MWSTSLESVGEDTSISGGTFVVGSGTGNTKGSYVELDASTAVTVAWFLAQFGHQSGSLAGEGLIDIAIGAAASEVVLIANINCGFNLSRFPINKPPILFPVNIASGIRIAARCQISITSTANILTIFLIIAAHSSITGSSVADTLGADTSDSGGTQIDPGASANTKGAYTQMVASSANLYNWLAINVGQQGNTARTDAGFLLDISTGAAASEVVLIPDVWFAIDAATDVITGANWSIGVNNIAASTRIAARAQSQTNDATDRLFDLILFGFNIPVPGGAGETSHVF